MIKNYSVKCDRIFYINIYDLFIDHKKKITKKYFLIDNLHLSKEGYAVWKKEIYKSIFKVFNYF